jgi:hypothetical protein
VVLEVLIYPFSGGFEMSVVVKQHGMDDAQIEEEADLPIPLF